MNALLALLTKKERRQLLVLLGIILLEAGLETFGVGLIFPLVQLMAGAGSSAPGLLARLTPFGLDDPYRLCFFAMGVFALKGVYVGLAARWKSRYCYEIQKSLSSRLFSTILGKEYLFFLAKNSAELTKNITYDISHVNVGILFHGISIASELVITSSILFVIAYLNPSFFLPMAITLLAVILTFNFALKVLLRRYSEEVNRSYGVMHQSSLESFAGAKEIKVYGKERFFQERFSAALARYCHASSVNQTLVQLPRPFLETVAIVVVLGFVANHFRVHGGIQSILPLLGAYIAAGLRLMPAMNRIISSMATIRTHLPSWKSVQAVMAAAGSGPNREVRNAEAMTLPFRRSLALEKVSFTYPGANRKALDSLSVEFGSAGLFGVAGMSGSGKSTLVDILLGLLKPSEGRLLLDGEPLVSIEAWQKNLGYVPQQIFLLDSSIAENVAFGSRSSEIDRTRVMEVLTKASLGSYLEQLPEGIETKVGERGGRMSGGQRQRIGIARALYHDPKLIVLDEATSALDSTTEGEISETIRELAKERAVIVVAHRLSTLRNCEKILMIDHGKLADAGTFSELNARCALFQDLVRNYFLKPGTTKE